MVNQDEGNLKSSVFFIWGGLNTCAFVYAYFLIPETKVSLFHSSSPHLPPMSNDHNRASPSSKSTR